MLRRSSHDARLHAIKGEDEVGPDGISVKARMERLVEQTATDIKKCANICDAYLKKKPVVKVLTGHKWDAILCRFSGAFHERRAEFEFALSVHFGAEINKANVTLDRPEDVTKQIQDRLVITHIGYLGAKCSCTRRMDALLAYFHTVSSSESQDIVARIKDKAGVETVLENERLLRELVDGNGGFSGDAVEVRGRRGVTFDVEELKSELREDIESTTEKNAQTFSRKFEMQRNQIMDQLSTVACSERGRFVDAVTSGLHDRIVDPVRQFYIAHDVSLMRFVQDLRAVWKEMVCHWVVLPMQQ